MPRKNNKNTNSKQLSNSSINTDNKYANSTVYKHTLIDLYKTGRFHVWGYSTMATRDDCI